MGLKEVKDDIISEAEEKAEKLEQEGEEKANEIIEEAEKEAESIKADAEEEIEKEKKKMTKQKMSSARMEARKRKQEAKQSALRRVFRDFRSYLEELSNGEREEFVENCVESAGFEVGKVKASQEFEPAVESQGFDPEELEDEGVVLVSENGERQQAFTLDRIVDSMKDEKRKEISEVLFS